MDPVRPDVDVVPVRQVAPPHVAYSVPQTFTSRAIAVGDSPAASSPSSPARPAEVAGRQPVQIEREKEKGSKRKKRGRDELARV